ncbi:MotA/TolQ/ExbB proton channel family protein [Nitrosomonas sp. Is37]|uniref:MotA/TolQ/ExbB proton channel family protein n=1 Tax=Nitrosomonas sp. Is37 TaxID=3080535 RepID=UPI00294B1AD2|nr:MotA/TolQ/ExbB proton channel family protein [Nitrosomonas sp. Is37]MDV6344655.1 MotA/TolQ/ExbB proton channel family protein [Nitrosomonas sp. Is37]
MSLPELIIWLKELMVLGGIVMPPLVLCILLLWYGVGYRFWVMKEPKWMGVRDMLKYYQENDDKPARSIVARAIKQGLRLKKQKGKVKNLRPHLDAAFYDYEIEITKFSSLTRVAVLIAPLLGLLGTITGMIETFQSLSTMTVHSQSGGIAGGIAEALFTTQMGLTVAVPGVLANSMLSRKQHQIAHDLAQVKELLCHQISTTNEK